MTWPASGSVTARFGEWRGSHRHAGIDIGMLRTLRLRAVTAGTVERTGYVPGYDGYGNVVVLDLDSPYTALYAISRRSGSGRASAASQGPAPRSGRLARAAAPARLHFEVKRRGVPVDPLRFLG